MLQSEAFVRALDLSPAEAAVVATLREEGRLRVVDLATQAQLPRSSVVDALSRLKNRRLVRPVAIGGHTEWKLAHTHGLAETFLNVAEYLQTDKHAPGVTGPTQYLRISKATEVVTYLGWHNIIRLYEQLFSEASNERVGAVQSTDSARTALLKTTPEAFISVNEAIKKHKLILESVISESMLTLYRPQGEAWLQSMEGRINALRIVPDELLSFSAEMIVFRDKVVLTEWTDESCIILHNPALVALLHQLFRGIYEQGKLFDQNAFLRTLLVSPKE